MHISAAMAADLAALTDALDDPAVDLESRLRALATSIARAVASFTGLTMTIRLDGHDISFSAADGVDTAAAETSLEIPLSARTAAQDGSSFVIFAAIPGALVDLAADLSYALDLDPGFLVPDRHLPGAATADGSGMAGLDESSLINQAIGVLTARGRTPEGALRELRRLADLDGGQLGAGADAVLGSLAARRHMDDRSAVGRDGDPPQ